MNFKDSWYSARADWKCVWHFCDGAREFDKGPQALVAHNYVVIRILTGPSVMVGAGALISDAFFLIHSRAMVTL